MKKILFLTCMVLFVVTGRAQVTDEAFYSLPDTIVINEADIYFLLQAGSYKVLYCDYFAVDRGDTLALADKKDKKVVKGLAMEFPNGGIFKAATVFSNPFVSNKKRESLCFASIRLLLTDGSVIELQKSWFLESEYYEALRSLNTVLRMISRTTTNQN